MSNIINNSDCIKVLKNYLNEENICFKSFEMKPISENVEGFLGEHYNLLIKYEKHGQEQTERFFIKTKPTKNKAQEEVTRTWEVYKREIFMYNFLFKEFKKCGLNVNFAAESYYYIKDTAIVMENLSDKGYSITERDVNLSVDHLKLALRALALYHGAGYAYEKIMGKKLGREFKIGTEFKEDLHEPFYVQHIDPYHYAMNWWKGFKTTLSTLIFMLPSDKFNRKHFHFLLDNFETGKIFAEESEIAKTCGHGDLWSNNMLFKYDGSKPVDCRLVDFQITRYFYPSFDLILVIFCNTDATFRNQHLAELYEYYHATLRGILKNYGFLIEEIYPWEHFMKSIKLVLADALSQVILAKFIVNLPKDKLFSLLNETDDGFKELMFNNNELVTETFKTSEEYRKMMGETMQEFYNALVEKDRLTRSKIE